MGHRSYEEEHGKLGTNWELSEVGEGRIVQMERKEQGRNYIKDM